MSDKTPPPSDKPSDSAAPWTIRGVAPEARNAAIMAAKRHEQSMGDWIGLAILAKIKADRDASRSVAIVAAPPAPAITQIADLDAVERLMAIAHQATNTALPYAITRMANSIARDGLKAIRASSRTKPPARQTEPPEGQTP